MFKFPANSELRLFHGTLLPILHGRQVEPPECDFPSLFLACSLCKEIKGNVQIKFNNKQNEYYFSLQIITSRNNIITLTSLIFFLVRSNYEYE